MQNHKLKSGEVLKRQEINLDNPEYIINRKLEINGKRKTYAEYCEFGGRTLEEYYEFGAVKSSVSGDGTGNVRRPLNYSNAVQGLFDGVQGHSRAIQGFLFFLLFLPFFYFFRPALRNYWTIGQNALRWTLP